MKRLTRGQAAAIVVLAGVFAFNVYRFSAVL
jgi:hypothetical protein